MRKLSVGKSNTLTIARPKIDINYLFLNRFFKMDWILLR